MKSIKWLILLLIVFILVLAFTNAKDIKRTEWTHKLHSKLTYLWFSKENAYIVIDWCKYAELKNRKVNARRCIYMATSIAYAESTLCQNALKNNCWWFRNQQYKTVKQAFSRRLKSYWKYWYKHTNPVQFITKSKYCTDEVSSWSSDGCPNWIINSTRIFNKLNN